MKFQSVKQTTQQSISRSIMLAASIVFVLAGITGLTMVNWPSQDESAQAATGSPVAAYIEPTISISDITSSGGSASSGNTLALKWNDAATGADGTQSFTVKTNVTNGYTLSDSLTDVLTRYDDNGVKQSQTLALTHSTADTATKTSATTTNGTFQDTYTYSFSVTATPASTTAGTYKQDFKYTATATLSASATIKSFSPQTYSIGSENNTLTLTGSGLTDTYAVFIVTDKSTQQDDTHRCAVLSTSDEAVTCTLPKDLAAGSYIIYLKSMGTGEAEAPSTITYATMPSVVATTNSGDTIIVDYDQNMIPVKYAGTMSGDVTPKWVKADVTTTGDWFNYNNKVWANAVTVKKDKLAYYQAAAAGTEVSNDDVLGYFVYVPRFAYEVMRRDAVDANVAAENFSIRFETATTTKSVPADCSGSSATSHNDYRTTCANSNSSARQYHSGTTNSAEVYDQTTWATHPAFTWGSGSTAKELNGIWVGKFETTGTRTNPTIKPNQMANVNETAGNEFTIAASIGVPNDATAAMGNRIDGITKNGHNLALDESHSIKSSEWGAVAYLSASIYGAGVNKTYNNAAYNHHSGVAYKGDATADVIANADADGDYGTNGWYGGRATGCGPTTTADGNSPYTPRDDITLNASNIEDVNVCEKDSSDTTHAYNQTVGVLASTTNNVYGIYDMAGGQWERVMAVGGKNVSSKSSYNDSYVKNAIKAPYLEFFSTQDGFGTKTSWSTSDNEYYYNNENCTWSTCGGHALHETKTVQAVSAWAQSWGSDRASFPNSSDPWLFRGGIVGDGTRAGLFATLHSRGGGYGSWSFRVVVAGPLAD